MFNITLKNLVIIGAIAVLSACSGNKNISTSTQEEQASQYGIWGFDTNGMDVTTPPGDDFFRYSNGAWIDRINIPNDKPQQTARLMMTDAIDQRVREILDAIANKAPHDPKDLEGKVGAFYKSFLNESHIESLAGNPIKSAVDTVKSQKSIEDLAALMGYSTNDFNASIFDIDIYEDQKDPAHNTIYISQSGLGLPDRNHYLESTHAKIKSEYEVYSAQLLHLLNWPDPENSAKKIIELETKIAEASWTKAQGRDMVSTYNSMTISELKRYVPHFPWEEFFRKAGLSDAKKVVVRQKTAFPKLAAIFINTPIETLKAWQVFHVADNAAPYLAKPFVTAHFEFHGKKLLDQNQQQPRWKQAIQAVGGNDNWAGTSNFSPMRTMDFAVGQLYVERYFPAESKRQVEEIAVNLKTVFRTRLAKNDWMTEQTKSEALKKLDSIVINVGYPNNNRDYSTLIINDDLIGNVRRINKQNWQFMVDRLANRVSQTEWPDDTAPHRNNSYFAWVPRSCFIPAGILQPPMFNPNADSAINYGAIAAIIGHELTHGFDDQGRKIDANGLLRDWWATTDESQFKQRSERLISQYSQFQPIPGMPNVKVKGDQTLGENIADLGGLLIALDAYHLSLNEQSAPNINGLTGDQRVFLGWAQAWRGKQTPSFIENKVIPDVHAPRQFRVNGVVRNIDDWYKTFGIESTNKLFLSPEDRVHIW